MNKKEKDKKNFHMTLDKDLWVFLKKQSANLEISMSDIINYLVRKEKQNKEKG